MRRIIVLFQLLLLSFLFYVVSAINFDEKFLSGGNFENTLEENVGHLLIGVHDDKEVRRLKEAVYKDTPFDTLYYYGNNI